VKDGEAAVEEFGTDLEMLRSLLENETLSRVDLQNNLQSLKEDLCFRERMYEEVCEYL
jgi:hypothetical protein